MCSIQGCSYLHWPEPCGPYSKFGGLFHIYNDISTADADFEPPMIRPYFLIQIKFLLALKRIGWKYFIFNWTSCFRMHTTYKHISMKSLLLSLLSLFLIGGRHMIKPKIGRKHPRHSNPMTSYRPKSTLLSFKTFTNWRIERFRSKRHWSKKRTER